MTGGGAIARQLAASGIDTLFGLPGVQTYALHDALVDVPIQYVGARHEQGAAYMALGYAQSTGRPGVYSAVPGPGVLNTTSALATALATDTRVLCIAGQVATPSIGRRRGELHELPDQLAILRGLTKDAQRIERGSDAPAAVARAIAQLSSGRPGPVALEVPMDVMAGPCDAAVAALVTTAKPAVDTDAIERAATIVAGARTPMLWIGSGAIGARAELLALAERLGAPIASWRGGRGIAGDDHPLATNVAAAWHLWERTDVLIVVGSRAETPFLRWPPRTQPPRIVRIDIDAAERDRLAVDVFVHADASAGVGALVTALGRRAVHRRSGDEIMTARATAAAEAARIQPQVGLLAALRDVMPRDAFLVEDMCQASYASWFAFPIHEPRTFVRAGYSGNLGFGYATAIGVKIAHPRRAVVALAGDGGFLFTMQELATAAQYRIGVVVVVVDNQGWGNVRRDQLAQFGRTSGADLTSPDFVRLAESFGVAGHRATDPPSLRRVLERALADDRPALIHVPIPRDSEASPWPLILRRT